MAANFINALTKKQFKPGPKGMVLEPYAAEVLTMAQEGRSMQYIVNWLAESSRGVTISRQAVDQWVKKRIAKIIRNSKKFKKAGFSEPFQGGGSKLAVPTTLRPTMGFDPPKVAPLGQPNPVYKVTGRQTGPVVDASEFLVDEAEWARKQNPFAQ